MKASTNGLRVVAMGGGTGLPVVLAGLKRFLGGRLGELTAIVTVTDDGGSSGRLRDELQILPPGDIRNCLVALAEVEPLMAQLFQHRFRGGGGLAGHSFGNLFLAALADVTGDFLQAIRVSSKVLAVRGTILPSTLENVQLSAELEDGTVVTGESQIPKAGRRIRRVMLEPPDCRPLSEALEAIDQAHAIVLAPGSLYTSLIPNLLVPGMSDALRNASGLKIYVANLMTEPGETDDHSLFAHLEALFAHGGPGTIEGVVVNRQPLRPALIERYRAAGAGPVQLDMERVKTLGIWAVEGELIGSSEVVRHHPQKLGRLLMSLLDDSTQRQ
ncbi:MAG: YvcK family protein [Candidatus Rokubacteria bacterium]|nr:YvcK family protein [Candidatus Rokubacteria bacterium]